MQQFLDLNLPPVPMPDSTELNSPLRLGDSSFEGNKVTSIHRWVPWIAGFSASFVRDTFRSYLPSGLQNACVLEPFSGVGTTLVEGILAGHDVIGFEVNPFAYLASNVKCYAYTLSPDRIQRAMDSFLQHVLPHTTAIDQAIAAHTDPFKATNAPLSAPPANFRSRVPFFSTVVELKVLHCLDGIKKIEDDLVRDLFLLAFGSILVGVSNYSYEPSLGSRVAAGRAPIDDIDVTGKLLFKLRGMQNDILEYQRLVRNYDPTPVAVVYADSSLNLSAKLRPRSVDIVVTSPPYLNNYHYIRNTRPHLFWLDFVASASALKSIENSSFGKFWQTVRDAPPMKLDFEYDYLSRLIATVADQNQNKGVYGGQGWANYAIQYFNDSYKICAELRYVLKSGANAVFVLGNSIVQGVEIPVDKIFGEIGKLHGLELVDIHMLRTKRVGNSVVKSAARHGIAAGALLYETAVVLRQPVN